MRKKIHRRDALRYTALAGVGIWLPKGRSSAQGFSPSEKLNIAVVGLGGRGSANLRAVAHENIVALCDVDDDRAGKAYEQFPKAKKYYDYRAMLEGMQLSIDAVVISTPDHTHAHAAVMAMRMGTHCYCEKPMAHAVSEVRAMTELAREKGLATQLGVQRHTLSNVHRVVEIIQSGAIGDVREVYCWVGGDRGMPPLPTGFPPVPKHLKWDLWLGPAKWRVYSPSYCPYNWRFWWEYGTGETGNWGCHILDIPFWALKLGHPIKVSATGPTVDPRRTPKSMSTVIEFPERGDLPPVTLHWCHAKEPLPVLREYDLPQKGNNTLFIGSKGQLLCGFGTDQRKLYPEREFAVFYEEPEQTIPNSPGFHQEWIDACKGGPPATCNFDYTGPLTEAILLGNVAYRARKSFEWDAAAMKAPDCPDINPFIRPEYRDGWSL